MKLLGGRVKRLAVLRENDALVRRDVRSQLQHLNGFVGMANSNKLPSETLTMRSEWTRNA